LGLCIFFIILIVGVFLLMSIERYQSRLAVSIIFKDHDKVLLLLRQNTGYADGLYTLPAGHVEANETIMQAAIREAAEETGAIIAPEDLKLIHVMYRKSNFPYVEFFWQCTNWRGKIKNNEPEKCKELAFYPLQQLPDNMVVNIKPILENGATSVGFSEKGWL
jgi:8-oxo-dGTP diphosphatase